MPFLQINGPQIHYHVDDYSDPWERPVPVLLQHSAGGNLHRWRPWVPTLARHHQVVRFDMRGHGKSSSPSGYEFLIADLAADISEVMDHLHVRKVHLVGASAGGIVSLRFAHDFPDRVQSLTLIASTPKLAQMGSRIDAGVWRRILEERGTKAWLLSDSQKRFGPDVTPNVIEWYAEEGSKTAALDVLGLQQCLLAQDLTELLPNISAPTLILASASDEITPPEIQRLMQDAMPNALLEFFDGVGHNMKVEIPDALAERTLAFFRDIDSR